MADSPSLRFLIWGHLHQDQFCPGPKLCNDHPTQHAPDCVVYQFQEAAESSHYHTLLSLVLELDFRATNHYHIDWSEVPADEYQAHKILLEERQRKEQEYQQELRAKQRG